MRAIRKIVLILALAAGLAVGIAGCGLQMGLPVPVPSGAVGGFPPSGANLIAQGSLSGENGASVSGSVAVYNQGNGSYTVQLQNLSASLPTGSVSVEALINGLLVSGGALSTTTGTSSYGFVVPAGALFQYVYLTCTTCSPLSTTYAQAALQ